MSDTPRTDARRGFHGWYTAVDAEFSEKLERELNAANDGIKRLEEENNELRAEEARLLNTNGELERRIKRLEEALDKTTKIGSKHIKRLEDSYAAKDAQLSNLLNICRANGIDVSSQDLIHGKEDKL